MIPRAEYKSKAKLLLNPEFVERVPFPELLREMAIQYFMNGDIYSDMAMETLRRLNELTDTGVTE